MNFNSFAIAFVFLGTLSEITLSAQTADFSVSAESFCAPSLVVIHNLSDENPGYEYLWDFGQGAVVQSSEKVLYETYTNPGNYTITLRLVNGTDTIKTQKNISVYKGPTANLTASPLSGCPSLHVTYSDNSTPGDAAITGYLWDFRNGDTYNGNPANYTYSSPGAYSIYLKVTDANGCSSYIESKDLVHVFNSPVAGFSASETFACNSPLDVQFTNLSTGTGTMNYNWDFGNGQHSTQFNGQATYFNGTYDVKLVVTDQNSCKDSITDKDLISVGTVTGDIFIRQDTQIFSTDNALLCPGNLLIYSSLPALPSMHWDIKYQGVDHTYNNVQKVNFAAPDSGKLDIRLIYNETSGCGDTLSKTFRIDYIKADFSMTPSFICQLPLDAQLTNQSVNAVSYDWLFPDNSESSARDTNYIFREQTSYRQEYTHHLIPETQSIRLIAKNANGCEDTATKSMNISLLVARFMPDTVTGCVPFGISLSDSSKSADPIVNWTYLIDGNKISNVSPVPVHYTFSSAGNYPVRLIIQNDLGCIDTSYQVMIHAGTSLHPMFSVSPASICSTGQLSLTDETSQQQLIDSWQYSSADLFNTGAMDLPDTSVFINAVDSGARDIKLSVESNGCVSDTVLNNVLTIKKPTGYFEEIFDCADPYNYSFVAHVDPADSFFWKINGTIFPRQDTLKYNFSASGDYPAELDISNVNTGCPLIRKKIIAVRKVKAYFTVSPVVCKGITTLFDASNSADYINECYVEGFLWYFKDKTPERRNYSPKETHIYIDTGTYSPQLIVTALNGCTDTATADLKVVEPSADFTPDPRSDCGPSLNVTFHYTGHDSTVNNWSWQFGDGQVSNSSDSVVSHIYQSNIARTYQALLNVEDIYGCKNHEIVPVQLNIPVFDFHADDNSICLGHQTQFTITSVAVDTFSWNFGDGTTSSTTNSHTYTQTGIYNVGVTVTKGGCQMSQTKYRYMSVEKADASYTLSDSVFTCYPAMVDFTHTGTGSPVALGNWTFGNGLRSSGYSSTAQYTYTEPGTYNTSLSILTGNGCSSTVFHTIKVTGPTANFSFTPNDICSGDSVHFTLGNTSNVDSYQWIFGDGSASTEANPVHRYTARGQIIPALRLVQADCEVTLTKFPLNVSTINAGFVLQPDSQNYCLNDVITASNISGDYSSSSWSLNGSEVATSANLTQSVTHLGENTIRLIVGNALGCLDTAETSFNVNPLPEFSITGDSSICAGNDIATLKVDQQPNWTINWGPAALIDNPGQFTVTTSPGTSTLITATVTDGYGCSAQQSFPITVRQGAKVFGYPLVDSIFLGQSLQLYVNGSNDLKYNWTPSSHISCTDCSNPLVSPHEKTIYNCEVTGGCTDTTLSYVVNVIIDFYLDLPDAFSPNGDGNNDVFITNHHNISEIDFRIFNRWGNLLFETNNLEEGWNGKSGGKLQNPDTYAYIIHATTIHGYEFEKRGTFLLLR